MAKKRRIPRVQNFRLDPIAVSEMNAVIDYSLAERSDGPTRSKGGDVDRRRDSHTTPINLGDLEYFVAYVLDAPVWEFAEEIAAELETRMGPGRPREYEIHSVIISDVMLYQHQSVRKTFRSLSSPLVWRILQDTVEKAWPNHPTRRLCDKPLSRDQYHRGRKVLLSEVFCYLDRMREHDQQTQLGIARLIGCFVDDDSLTHPSNHNIMYGDATWLESMFRSTKKDSPGEPETGEILRRN